MMANTRVTRAGTATAGNAAPRLAAYISISTSAGGRIPTLIGSDATT